MRRALGVVGFGYLAVHFLVFFLLDRQASVASTVHEIATRRYLWFGTGALVLMTPLAATSVDAMVARLGATAWKRLHRLAYPIAIGAVIHYYLLVKSDVTQPLAFPPRSGSCCCTRGRATAAPGSRRAARARLAGAAPRRHRGRGRQLVSRGSSPRRRTSRRFASPRSTAARCRYLRASVLNLALCVDGRRSATLHVPVADRGGHCGSRSKRGQGGLCHLHDAWREGQRVRVSGPAGAFVFDPASASRVVLIAGGIGITPLLATIRSLTDRTWRGDIHLLYSVRTAADIAFRDELAWLAARANCICASW
jgi:hypothetical protein